MNETPKLHLQVVGSPDFARRVLSLSQNDRQLQVTGTSISEAWNVLVSARPNFLLIEIGLTHNERKHRQLRLLLTQLRERFGSALYIMVALTAAEKLMYGGDLLFANEQDIAPSGFVDTYLAVPPAGIPSVPNFGEQFHDACEHARNELTRRLRGKVPLPALNSDGWVPSLVDPSSRALWMKWLPRYATYTNENPIIIGRTGTGKTRLAFALHLLSGRKGRFVSITPRDFSSSELVQAELFGAVAGAYTGAVDKWGLVKSAENGTLFFDELQSIDKDLQGKLITFIENKAYRRVGSAESVEADVRFVFASNKTLQEMMDASILRDDFAYRLERVQLELGPLYLRRLDISAALACALAKVRRQRPGTLQVEGVTANAYRILFCARWPGNLRQLENVMAQLCEFADMQNALLIDEVTVAQVVESRLSGPAFTTSEVISHAAFALAQSAFSQKLASLEDGLSQLKERIRICALEACAGDSMKAAEMLSDDPELLTFLAETIIAKKETDLLQ